MASDQIYIYPTDTVWGIGCDMYSKVGFQEIARIKNTTDTKPLSVLFTDVDEVLKSFSFPQKITREWLEYFFSQESTLGVPAKWSKKEIPEWAHKNSEYISLRCLNSAPLKSLCKKISNPIFTTSLNLQSESPILKEEDARKFCAQFCPNAIIIQGNSGVMSGLSSTMIFIDNNLDFHIQREGRKLKELIKHMDQLRLA